jgi:hypothetical protein
MSRDFFPSPESDAAPMPRFVFPRYRVVGDSWFIIPAYLYGRPIVRLSVMHAGRATRTGTEPAESSRSRRSSAARPPDASR